MSAAGVTGRGNDAVGSEDGAVILLPVQSVGFGACSPATGHSLVELRIRMIDPDMIHGGGRQADMPVEAGLHSRKWEKLGMIEEPDTEGVGTSWRAIASVEEVPSGDMKSYRVEDFDLAVYNVEGQIFATDNICTHAYAVLTDGWLEGHLIECPLHGGQFNICTGKAMCEPAEIDLATYPVRVSGGRIEILLPVQL